jgi:Mg-chelatase subunit ChlI
LFGYAQSSAVQNGRQPRASRAVFKAAKAVAAIGGRDFVTPDDIQRIAVPVSATGLRSPTRPGSRGKRGIDRRRDPVGVPVPPAAARLSACDKMDENKSSLSGFSSFLVGRWAIALSLAFSLLANLNGYSLISRF